MSDLNKQEDVIISFMNTKKFVFKHQIVGYSIVDNTTLVVLLSCGAIMTNIYDDNIKNFYSEDLKKLQEIFK